MAYGLLYFYRLSAIIATPAIILYSAVILYRINRNTAYKSKESAFSDIETLDLNDLDNTKIVFPLKAKALSAIGIIAFFAAFGLSGLFTTNASLPYPATAAISVCIGITACVCFSMIHYAIRLKHDKTIIFVPRSIGLTGVVHTDIPARQKGQGNIRIVMNEYVTQIKALSGDETVLAKGTPIKIVYADNDQTVIVERYVKGKEDEVAFDASKYY